MFKCGFIEDEGGAVTVDWVVLTAGVTGLGLAVMGVVSGGVENLSGDIRDQLLGQGISTSFRSLIEQACAADGGAPTGTYQDMPITSLLIYEADDFVGGLPDERSGGGITGTAPHNLVLRDDAQPVRIDIADNDNLLHELDEDQVLVQSVELNGEIYGEGFDVRAAYNATDSATGQTITSLHFGDPFSGYTVGPVIATAATSPLEPGQSVTFDEDSTTHRNELSYDDYLTCGTVGMA